MEEDECSGKPLISSGSIEPKNQAVNSGSPSALQESREPGTDGKRPSDTPKPDGRTGDGRQQDCPPAQRVESYIRGLVQRRASSSRPVKPRTSLPSAFRQVSVSEGSTPAQAQEPSPQAFLNQEAEHRPTEEGLNVFRHRLEQSVQYQLGLYLQPQQPSATHTPSLDSPSCRVLQSHQDSEPSDSDSSQYFLSSSSPPGLRTPPPNRRPACQEERLVNAEYIPARPCRASTRASTHRHANPKGPGVTKPNRSTCSPERGRHQDQNQAFRLRGGPKKCRPNEDRHVPGRRAGKKACRSQSDFSLSRAPDRKYNTVERDGGGSGGRGGRGPSKSKKQQQGCGGSRRWRSSLDLSQDEADPPPTQDDSLVFTAPNQRDQCPRRTRRPRPPNASYGPPQDNQQQQHDGYQRDRGPPGQASGVYPPPGQADSESSLSEADSPDSSTSSSDSDESGGLVWPQQVSSRPPVLLPPVLPGAPSHPEAFVKIKASHALKKKILRFRSGSLKLMTTV